MEIRKSNNGTNTSQFQNNNHTTAWTVTRQTCRYQNGK